MDRNAHTHTRAHTNRQIIFRRFVGLEFSRLNIQLHFLHEYVARPQPQKRSERTSGIKTKTHHWRTTYGNWGTSQMLKSAQQSQYAKPIINFIFTYILFWCVLCPCTNALIHIFFSTLAAVPLSPSLSLSRCTS